MHDCARASIEEATIVSDTTVASSWSKADLRSLLVFSRSVHGGIGECAWSAASLATNRAERALRMMST